MAPGCTPALLIALAFLSMCASGLAAGEDGDDYAIFYSVDDTKVSIVSGNLTVAVTRDWPRVLFWHSDDPFSPTFEVGFPKLYLFNDTDRDGRFCRSEAVYTVYLDSNRVEWNLSSVSFGYEGELGESISFSMTARANAFNDTLDAPPAVESWANVTFWFRVAENTTTVANPAGSYGLSGKTEMLVDMSIEVTNRTEFDAVALERFLQGGGTTDMFEILEDGRDGAVSAVLSGRVDESAGDGDFTRPLNMTDSAVQSIEFAKDDGTVQAFYSWGSEAVDASGSTPGVHLNSSCFTTGAGLILHSVVPLSNGTASISHDSSVGLVEEGFVGAMTDWIREHGLVLGSAAAVAAVAGVVALHLVLRRRRFGGEGPEERGAK
ncbi:MAG: hypothetical protein AB1793_06435 [Candidatus Thermoplasmatota archaeon]